MSQNDLRTLQMLAPAGADYAVTIAGRVRAVNLTRETAVEWANSYAHLGARVVPMESLSGGRNSYGTTGGCETHNRIDCVRCEAVTR